jgi:hypothetical protein
LTLRSCDTSSDAVGGSSTLCCNICRILSCTFHCLTVSTNKIIALKICFVLWI